MLSTVYNVAWLSIMNFETMIIRPDDLCQGTLFPSSEAIKRICMLMSLERTGWKLTGKRKHAECNKILCKIIIFYYIKFYRIFITRRICMKTKQRSTRFFYSHNRLDCECLHILEQIRKYVGHNVIRINLRKPKYTRDTNISTFSVPLPKDRSTRKLSYATFSSQFVPTEVCNAAIMENSI